MKVNVNISHIHSIYNTYQETDVSIPPQHRLQASITTQCSESLYTGYISKVYPQVLSQLLSI